METESVRILQHRINSHEKTIGELVIEMRTKVTYKIFWTLFCLLISIMIAILGYLVVVTTKTQTDVATITGKLEPYDIQFAK